MVRLNARRERRGLRDRQRSAQLGAERLEGRQLMAYTALGYSLPDLTVTGYAAPTAAYGGGLAVTVDVQNLGASTLTDPLAQEPGSLAHADAGPTTVAVYISPTRHFGKGSVKIGEISVAGALQNSLVHQTANLRLPGQLPGLPRPGGHVFVEFQLDPGATGQDFDRTNNVYVDPTPVQLSPNLPDLRTVGFEVPPVLQPGDTIQPNIRIENLGTVNSNFQGKPVVVELIASLGKSVGAGSTLLASYTISNVAPLAATPTKSFLVGDVNLNPTPSVGDLVTVGNTSTTQPNIVTIFGAPLTLPRGPRIYNIGVVIDRSTQIPQIHEIVHGPDLRLAFRRRVGPPIKGLPTANTINNVAPSTNLFPTPPYGRTNQGTAGGGTVIS